MKIGGGSFNIKILKTQPNMSKKSIENPEELSAKSEEVQHIIERMPTYWAKWVVLCVSVLMGIIILLGFVIQYPDVVAGQISITATEAPVRLVANSHGRITLLQPNGTLLQPNDMIAYIESGANFEHILWLHTLLHTSNCHIGYSLPDTLLLGAVSTAYNAFLLAHLHHERLLTSDVFATMRQNLHRQIDSDFALIANLQQEKSIKTDILQTSSLQLQRDSMLFAQQLISALDYQQQTAAHQNMQRAQIALHSHTLMRQSDINRNTFEIQRIELEEIEMRERAYAELITRRNELQNAISLWKERYLLFSPIEGELEYLGFWRDNSFVQAGQELFTVIPYKYDILGEVTIPSFGAGRVEEGQTVNVKLNAFPHTQFGLLRGEVTSLSRTTNRIQTEMGAGEAYLVLVAFPEGTVTNFGNALPIDFETRGTAEIITKRRRLIQRLFDNLRAQGER